MHWTYQDANRIVFSRDPLLNKINGGIAGKQPARHRIGALLVIRFRDGVCRDPIRVALDTAAARRGLQHSDLDAVILVPRAFLDRSRESGFERGRSVRRHWTVLPRGGHTVEF